MPVKDLTSVYQNHSNTRAFANWYASSLGNNANHLHLKGLCGSAKSLFAATSINQTNGTHWIIIPDREEAAYLHADLSNLPRVMDGELDKLIDTLITTDQAEQLAAFVETSPAG